MDYLGTAQEAYLLDREAPILAYGRSVDQIQMNNGWIWLEPKPSYWKNLAGVGIRVDEIRAHILHYPATVNWQYVRMF